eukprot:5841321-Pyramimonas_sp.AAC.1
MAVSPETCSQHRAPYPSSEPPGGHPGTSWCLLGLSGPAGTPDPASEPPGVFLGLLRPPGAS